MLADPATTTPEQLDALRDLAQARGLELSIHRAARASAIEPAIEEAIKSGAEMLNVLASALFNARRRRIVRSLSDARLPSMFQWPEAVQEGALVAYGPRLDLMYVQAARMLVKVLRGTKPADIPAEQPSKIELAVNLKTAKALGIEIAPTLLARADEVIE